MIITEELKLSKSDAIKIINSKSPITAKELENKANRFTEIDNYSSSVVRPWKKNLL